MAGSYRIPRRKSAIELRALVIVLFFIFCIVSPFAGSSSEKHTNIEQMKRRRPIKPLPCNTLPGAEDTVIVLKTSAAELENKLSVHINTTLQCFSNTLIFSDYQEDFEGYHIIDVLENSDQRLREKNVDFELWRRLRKGGPDVLEDEDIWNADDTARIIEKWNWLPMVDRAFQEYPDKKWYVFLETDSSILWSTVLSWPQTIDPKELYYIGALNQQAAMMNLIHADAGLILSQAAIKRMIDLLHKNPAGWDERTSHHSGGEQILAEVAADAQIPFTDAWPILQHQRLASLDYTTTARGRRLWCSPSVSYGGMSKGDIAEMWNFEQEWSRGHPGQIIRHKDVFNHFISPRLIVRSGRVDNWDNLSDEEGPAASNVAEFQDVCVKMPGCVQFSLVHGRCHFSSAPRLGEHKRDAQSRWLLARAQEFAEKMEHCSSWET